MLGQNVTFLVPAKSVARKWDKREVPGWSLKISKCKLCKESTVDVAVFFVGGDIGCPADLSLTQVLDLKKNTPTVQLFVDQHVFFVPLVFEFGRSSSL